MNSSTHAKPYICVIDLNFDHFQWSLSSNGAFFYSTYLLILYFRFNSISFRLYCVFKFLVCVGLCVWFAIFVFFFFFFLVLGNFPRWKRLPNGHTHTHCVVWPQYLYTRTADSRQSTAATATVNANEYYVHSGHIRHLIKCQLNCALNVSARAHARLWVFDLKCEFCVQNRT